MAKNTRIHGMALDRYGCKYWARMACGYMSVAENTVKKSVVKSKT